MKKTFFYIAALFVVLYAFNRLNGNFSVANIRLNTWIEVQAPDCPMTAEVDAILDQPFRYLGRGRQFFAFESEDGKYILKFIKCQRINVTDFYKKVPLPTFLDKKRQRNLQQKEERLRRLFASMSLAYMPLKEQTGILYLHMQPRKMKEKKVLLIDRVGLHHTLDISTVPFILQKKAMKVMPVLKKLYAENRMPELTDRLHQLVELFTERAEMGILNLDNAVFRHNNIGFIEERAIYIDVGSFVQGTKVQAMKKLNKDLKKLKPIYWWLKKRDKELAASFLKEIYEK